MLVQDVRINEIKEDKESRHEITKLPSSIAAGVMMIVVAGGGGGGRESSDI